MAAKQTKSDFADPWDLLGDPSAFGLGDLGDWGPLPEWGAPDPVDAGDFGLNFPDPGDGSMGPPSPDGGSNWSSIGNAILRFLNPGGGSGGGSGGSGGGFNLASLIPLLALGGGSLFQRNNTQQATDAMLAANTDAANLIRGQMDSGANRFLPYTDQGREAIWNMNAGGAKPLAQNFQPLGSGRGMAPTTLGKLARGR